VQCRLEDADYLEYPLQIPKDDQLPHPLPRPSQEEENKLILLVQVRFEPHCAGLGRLAADLRFPPPRLTSPPDSTLCR
jgi:hypothetical protein